MQLFYNPELNESTEEFAFQKEESKHIIKVLRKTTGDIMYITNGKGWLFSAKIIIPNINKCTAQVVSKVLQESPKYLLHLAVAPTKMNDRYEWFLEKATEIGIHSITPIICDHSERKIIKPERFNRILQSAMKQSLSCFLPKLNEAISFKAFVQQDFNGDRFIAHCEEMDRKSLKETLKPKTNTTILIGPEGDFSKNEIEQAIKNSFVPVTLGQSRLRTETAAIVACHSAAYTNE
ncbi:16S rRNA (uracil(1498)-N(3))-methyltransferase [Algibacter mikhailovii]|uniref:Ribosomal RNA small subunit methyltransferase E n=1 Tax=Algibacter mikhailovii TaxID=425498 RepID=A0A918QQI9_9FLAO|nr:16S rRNA (uracil(1498)-N(3))-methyltransferase [Algibacter mikhailovii]GGZ68078.1 ribosomal RNA small subunit methyltransferase E [Algibacter mikhailovii]